MKQEPLRSKMVSPKSQSSTRKNENTSPELCLDIDNIDNVNVDQDLQAPNTGVFKVPEHIILE